MELSKLNISSIAKEEIRRRFFDSRFAKNKTSDVSDSPGDFRPIAEKESHEVKQEQEKPQIPHLEEETTGSEDDGFPLITSVFSLALSSRDTGDEGCSSADEICVSSSGISNPPGTLQSITFPTMPSSSNVPACEQESLPFVVKCSSKGVITVCSPPNPTSTSSSFKDDRQDSTTITSSVEKSISSSNRQMLSNTTTCSLPNSAAGSNSTIVTFIDATQQIVVPVDKPRSEVEKYLTGEKSEILSNADIQCSTRINENEVQTRVSSSQTTVSSVLDVPSAQETSNLNMEDSSDEKVLPKTESNMNEQEETDATHSSLAHGTLNDEKATDKFSNKEEKCVEQPIVTKQEEKIRQLKDLLRQKEVELEKLRFKGKAGSVSPATQLRENFLRKNPSLCRRSQRLNKKDETEPTGQVTTPELTNKDKRLSTCDKDEIKCKKIVSSKSDSYASEQVTQKDSYSSEREMFEKADAAISTTTSIPKGTKFTEQDKYKFVNVTILQGHTRTLAVPVENENSAAVTKANNAPNYESNGGKVTTTTARKRKQETPKKFGRNFSKRKSSSEDDITSQNSFGQGKGSKRVKQFSPVSSESSKPQYYKEVCPTGPSTRSSPRRREGNHPCKHTPAKRKSECINESKAQGAPNKAQRTATAPTPKARETVNASSSILSTSALTLRGSKAVCSTELTITSDKSTTRPTATITGSTRTTTQNGTTLNRMNTSQLVGSSTTGKKVAYVVHTNGAGAETDTKTSLQSSGAANLEIVKRVVESMSRQVFALVGKEPEIDTGSKEGCETNNSLVTSSLSETKASPQQSPHVYATSAANSCAISTSTKQHAPASCNDSPKSPIVTTTVIPVNINRLTYQTVNSTATSEQAQQLPVSSCHSKQIAQSQEHDTNKFVLQLKNTVSKTSTTISSPNLSNTELSAVENSRKSSFIPIAPTMGARIPVTKTNIHDKKISTETPSSSDIDQSASLVSNNQMTAVVSGINKQANSNNHVGSPLKKLTVKASAPVGKSDPVALKTRTLVPKPTYTLATVAVPVAIGRNASNTSNAYVLPTKNIPNTTLKSLLLAPKPTSPQYTSHRLLAPKPTPTQNTIPAPTSLTPIAAQALTSGDLAQQSNSSQPAVLNTALVQSTSGNIVVSHPTSPQSGATKPAKSEPVNPVNVLPKPILAVSTSSTGFPQNLNNGKIVVYDVVQSNLAQGGRNPPVASKDGAKLVVYVSNTGETRNLGIIKDQKIYLNSNQDTTLENQPKLKSPVTISSSEFIPNPEDKDFKVLLGLEHVVELLR